MRTLVSYDDISQPYQPPPSSDQASASKKRKRNPRKRQRRDGESSFAEDESTTVLSHEEIWDDSALIDAWNAANEEYEMHHGPEKEWKKDPVHRSPLWYSVLPNPADSASLSAYDDDDDRDSAMASGEDEEETSRPIQFDSFVPHHDPTLGAAQSAVKPTILSEAAVAAPYSFMDMPIEEVSQRLDSANWWAGYWSGVRQAKQQLLDHLANQAAGGGGDAADDGPEEEAVEGELYAEDADVALQSDSGEATLEQGPGLLSTQR